jgi:TolB-like protein
VLPFQCAQGIEPADVRRIADALVHDLITRIAKLRSIHVVAPASMFTLRERGMSPTGVAEVLGADYVFNGTIRSDRTTCRFEVQLVHTSLSRVLWANSYDFRRQLTFEVLEDLGDKIVASVVSQIESNETRRAVLRSPESLDAWDSYHRGLWHAYRFNKLDNSRALHFFETAAKLDPTFSRAHAGISFAHFQTAMQRWDSREIAIQRALASASESLNADDCDPAAHWAMGRALWLQDEQTNALTELRKTLELSPNFALGHYTLAFVQAQSGDAKEAIEAADRSRRLSPFDPLLFGMLGARSIALLRLGDIEQAADCAKQAARRPNAHVHIFAIAACCAALAGQLDDAQQFVMKIRRTRAQYRANDLLEAFRFDSNAQSSFTRGAAIAGLM